MTTDEFGLEEGEELTSGLAADFEAACENPDTFDFAFNKQRSESNFANFGVDPEKADGLRRAELLRIYEVHGEQVFIQQCNLYGYDPGELVPALAETEEEIEIID